ncbi:hypothetical protein [Rhodoflexus caldus]|uniref:hypothetical protein n=1 Tax=Rhodoflexus caldus TaxID=2891236 RepID=UPI002029C6F4|nr:hypothetical protein [Rhodoflexus caldus]
MLAAYPIFNKAPYIPKRIENIAYLWWLFSVIAIVLATVQYLWLQYKLLFGKLPDFLTVAILIFIASKIFSVNTKVGLAWKVLVNGQAKACKQQYYQRHESMQKIQRLNFKSVVYVKPIQMRLEELIFIDDLHYRYMPRDFNNRAHANYFGMDSVLVWRNQ